MADLIGALRIKAGMIQMCERIEFGSEARLMLEAADRIADLEAEVYGLREDAARYRWMREADGLNLECLDMIGEELDSYIDAERNGEFE